MAGVVGGGRRIHHAGEYGGGNTDGAYCFGLLAAETDARDRDGAAVTGLL